MKEWWSESLAGDPRWAYGTPPQGNANFAWLQHMIYHLSPKGKMALLLANGSMSSQTSGEGEIRKKHHNSRPSRSDDCPAQSAIYQHANPCLHLDYQ